MFDLFRTWCDWWLVALLLCLQHVPILLFLAGPWRYRRDEITSTFTSSAAALYFKTFQHLRRQTTFQKYYNQRFGRWRYAFPLVFLAAVSGTALLWGVTSILAWVGLREVATGLLGPTPVAALSGAYAWTVADLLTRWRYRDLLPIDLWWSTWRFVIAVPLAVAVGQAFAPALSAPVAFLLGAFPTRSITTLARRFARRALDLGADTDSKSESQLEELQGVDTRIAERFSDEGITTILQLAYSDPVELTMRCPSFSFSFVVDLISQALAWIYLGDALNVMRLRSLRGAQEIATLIAEIAGDDAEAASLASTVVTDIAALLKVDQATFTHTLREIAEDPFTQFLSEVWATG